MVNRPGPPRTSRVLIKSILRYEVIPYARVRDRDGFTNQLRLPRKTLEMERRILVLLRNAGCNAHDGPSDPGRHAATGDFREIRRLMTDRPHVFVVRSGDDRRLAAAIIADGSARSVQLTDAGLQVEAVDFRRFTWLLPRVARDADVRLWEVSPSDESLESVFSYLVGT